jgi:fructuronate reductase
VKRLTRSEANRPETRIIHLGPGAFFRAFNATYTADCGDEWGITAVSLRSGSIRDKLAPQGFAYTAVSLGPDGMKSQVIEVLNDVLVAPENPAKVLAVMVDPAVKIVSMTITEKGYCHNPATGELALDHPEINYDLTAPHTPKSAIGFLVHALAQRRDAGVDAFTVLSCDNLPDNGALTRRVVLDFAEKLDKNLATWIDENATFPATMVDRITPATTDADIAELAELTGYDDLGCVMHEPFRQWVIEDNFVGNDRPSWDLAGAQFVRDVAAFETMKLRCLNGTHSALAYLGYLAGYETISQTVADPDFENLLDNLWHHEIIPTVPQPEGEDLTAYCATLKTRYQNPAIAHRTWQIAMDGSQKLPQRILGTIADNLAAGRPIDGLALVVAAWMRYVGGVDEKGDPIDVRDPLADILRSAQIPKNLLDIGAIFDPDLSGNTLFREAVIAAHRSLKSHGAVRTIQNLNA